MQTDFSNNRFEIKYIMPVRSFPRVKEALTGLLVADGYHSDLNDGYYNQSIYFDTPDFNCYFQKREGLNERVKVRLRAHKNSLDGAPTKLMLEIKHRLGNIGKKDRHPLSLAEAKDLLASPGFSKLSEDGPGPVRAIYNRLVKQSTLSPVVSVLYHRQAYHMPLYPGIRLTFDKGVRVSSISTLDAPLTSYHYALESQQGVIELKYFSTLPRLIASRFRELSLSRATFSKYAAGIETLFRQVTDNHHRGNQVAKDLFASRGHSNFRE
jgi:hypothetical protein